MIEPGMFRKMIINTHMVLSSFPCLIASSNMRSQKMKNNIPRTNMIIGITQTNLGMSSHGTCCPLSVHVAASAG